MRKFSHKQRMMRIAYRVIRAKAVSEPFQSSSWTYARLNEIINGKRGVSVDSALAFGEALNTGADFWLTLQKNRDLWYSMQTHEKIPPLKKAG